MLRIIQSKSVGQAKNYYTESLRNGDYYLAQEGEQLERHGHWHGQGAEQLGLAGQAVSESTFFALAENLHPATGDALTGKAKPGRTVGYDFNFHAPKSLSVLLNVTEDQRIVEEFQKAVKLTMSEIEQDMRTRVRAGGQNAERSTGNMVWADFTHHTSRPVDGIPDPHLHMHCFAFNATFDQVEEKWKAGQFRDIKRDASYFEAVFHAHLAKQIADLGYSVNRTGDGPAGWEVAAVSRQACEKFQRRTDLIEQEAERLGIRNEETKAELGAQTRERKGTERFSLSQLRQLWKNRLTSSETSEIAWSKGTHYQTTETTPQRAILAALEHCFERQSVVSEREAQKHALKNGVGSVDVESFRKAWSKTDLIKADIEETWSARKMVTTAAVLLEEQRMVKFVREGRGTCWPLGNQEFEFAELQNARGEAFELNAGQRAAVRHILNSIDRVVAVRGAAGVGKTTLMKEAVRGIEETGQHVLTFAPSADASRGTLREEGFRDAETVARLLVDKDLQRKAKDNVLWIDEAGLLGVRDLAKVLKIANQQNARVVLSGDTKQHASVARGDAFRILQDQAGLSTVAVTEILRQKPTDYKSAITDISQGRIEQGFAKLDEMGAIKEVADEDRYLELAAAYLEATVPPQPGGKAKTALVVSPTHREGDRVTAVIRDTLKAEGRLGEQDRSVLRLRNLQLTEAERKDAVRYRPGQVIQFHQNVPGFQRGERVEVTETHGSGNVFIKNSEGFTVNLPLQSAKHFAVYEQSELHLTAGDRIRITANGKSADGKHRLNNGSIYQVRSVTAKGEIELENRWKLSPEFGHLAHGYVTTSHASQGKTVDTVLIAQSSESFGASNREQFYVSASRGKQAVYVFTDDRERLQQAIARSGQRLAASELDGPLAQAALRRERQREFMQRVQHLAVYTQTLAMQAAAAGYRWAGKVVEQTARELNKPVSPYR